MGHDFTRAAVIEDFVLRSPVRVKVTGKVLGVNVNHLVERTTMMLKIWGVSAIGSAMRQPAELLDESTRTWKHHSKERKGAVKEQIHEVSTENVKKTEMIDMFMSITSCRCESTRKENVNHSNGEA